MNTCRGVKTLHFFCKTVFILTAFAVLAACGGGKKTTDKTSQTAEKSLPIDAALKQRLVDFASARRPKGNFGVYVYDLTANKLVFADHENHSLLLQIPSFFQEWQPFTGSAPGTNMQHHFIHAAPSATVYCMVTLYSRQVWTLFYSPRG